MERCDMDVGRSGHGAVAGGGVGMAAAAGAVGGDRGHPVVSRHGRGRCGCSRSGSSWKSRSPCLIGHVPSHGEPQWPVAASVPARCLTVRGRPCALIWHCQSSELLLVNIAGSANIHALEKPRTVKNMAFLI
ncbi:uncharacterized protein [Triticum aestivum]|uniref:uncharacterized protein n=1 Tax=Triticum aestivum TaxID=4565 RepID=UPI001D0020FA|nr:uncharacterized protein LOC123160547 [Triticum aestivum]